MFIPIVKQYLRRKANSQGTFGVKGFMALFIIVAVLGIHMIVKHMRIRRKELNTQQQGTFGVN